ncbi:hypothetical protein F4779DRAFT_602630 [Xylariaceae sp. FL0662B]|nr:hypothetical protein F4779DRAFT_602630 [Xylariaceae sp. FL0662B]
MRFSVALAAAFTVSVHAGVFTQQNYDDISISGGVAGNAEQEALAVFSALDMNNLSSADEDDISFLDSVNSICNDAEKEAFNTAIEAASGEEADALQRGKIKNKVLKLEATMLRLMIEQAQGEDVADEIEAEQKKLDNNIQQDEDEAGNESTFSSFDATTE